jgi:hypothetical protein
MKKSRASAAFTDGKLAYICLDDRTDFANINFSAYMKSSLYTGLLQLPDIRISGK